MMTRMGSFMTDRASSSTLAGIVAENSALWRLLEVHAAMISSVWSSKPNSKSLSASSRTRYLTLYQPEQYGCILSKFKTFLVNSMDKSHRC